MLSQVAESRWVALPPPPLGSRGLLVFSCKPCSWFHLCSSAFCAWFLFVSLQCCEQWCLYGLISCNLCLAQVRKLLVSLDVFYSGDPNLSHLNFSFDFGDWTTIPWLCCVVQLWIRLCKEAVAWLCDTGVQLSGVNAEGALGYQVTQSLCVFS